MAKLKPDAEIALHKLGQRIREGHARKCPTPDKSLQTVKDAVREQYEQDQEVERGKKPAPDNEKEPERHPPEPDHGR
jgi:hypothetical protein